MLLKQMWLTMVGSARKNGPRLKKQQLSLDGPDPRWGYGNQDLDSPVLGNPGSGINPLRQVSSKFFALAAFGFLGEILGEERAALAVLCAGEIPAFQPSWHRGISLALTFLAPKSSCQPGGKCLEHPGLGEGHCGASRRTGGSHPISHFPKSQVNEGSSLPWEGGLHSWCSHWE